MSATEWFLLIVVVILIPLAIAVAVTLWSLEQARQRNKKNRPNAQVRRVAIPRKEASPASPQTGEAAVNSEGINSQAMRAETEGADRAGQSSAVAQDSPPAQP